MSATLHWRACSGMGTKGVSCHFHVRTDGKLRELGIERDRQEIIWLNIANTHPAPACARHHGMGRYREAVRALTEGFECGTKWLVYQ